MKKSPLKFCCATLILILSFTSFIIAGEGQCPIAPPPPDEDDRVAVPVVTNTNPSLNSDYQFLNGFWEILAQSTDLF